MRMKYKARGIRRVKGWISLGILFILFSQLFSLKSQAKTLKIVTSFYPMYALTQEIVQDLHEVEMIQSKNGIHGFEPSAADVANIYDADIFIYHSNNLESWARKLAASHERTQVVFVEVAKDLEMQRVEGLEDVESIEGMSQASMNDPHTWLDPYQLGQEALLIAKHLSELDPDNEEIYQSRGHHIAEVCQAMIDHYQPIFAGLKKRAFVTQHTAFSYLAQRFDLKQLGIAGIHAEAEPSIQQVVNIRNYMQEHGVSTIFVEPKTSERIAKTIAKETGARIETLDPLETWPDKEGSLLDHLENNLKILSQVLNEEE